MPKPLSFEDTRDLLRAALSSAIPGAYIYIRSTDPASVVYEQEPRDGSLEPSATFRRPYTIDAKTMAVTLGSPEAVRRVETYEVVVPASFSLESPTLEDDHVVWRGKIFELGDYPDKEFSLDEPEADAAVAAFTPVPANIEHRASPFDGLLGDLTEVERRGSDLYGAYRMPKSLHALFAGKPLKVSLEFNRETKLIRAIGLTKNPRITDAALTAAFNTDPSIPRMGASMKGNLKKLLAMFSKATPEEIDAVLAESDPASVRVPNDKPDAELERLRSEIADRDRRIEELKGSASASETERIAEAATAFAESVVADERATPAEAEAIRAAFTLAVTSDNAGRATFSATGGVNEGVNLAALKAMIGARPKLGLLAEQLKEKTSAAIFSTPPIQTPGGLDTTSIYAGRAQAMNSAKGSN